MSDSIDWQLTMIAKVSIYQGEKVDKKMKRSTAMSTTEYVSRKDSMWQVLLPRLGDSALLSALSDLFKRYGLTLPLGQLIASSNAVIEV
jgi:hypothetical protein